MFHGLKLKNVFHKDKSGQNLLKDGVNASKSGQERRKSSVSEGARRVLMSDISGDRPSQQADSERRSSSTGQRGSQESTTSPGKKHSLMDSRPLQKRNKASTGGGGSIGGGGNEPSSERSAQALELAMMTDGVDARCDGNMKISGKLTTPAEIMCCRFSSGGQHLAIGLVSGETVVYAVDTLAAPRNILRDDDTIDRVMPVTCLRFIPVPEGKPSVILIATYGDGLIKFWRYLTGECVQTIDVDEQVLALTFDAVAKYFQIAGEDGTVRVYDAATGEQAGLLRASSNHALNDGHRSRVFALAAHPSRPEELLSAGWDNTVQFWDMRHVHAVRRIYGPHVCGEGLSIHPNADQILTASWRRRQALQVWDYATGELITDLMPDPYESMQSCGQYSDRGNLMISAGGYSNIVRLIDCRTFMSCGLLRNLAQSVRCQDVTLRQDKQFPRIVTCYGSDALIVDTWI